MHGLIIYQLDVALDVASSLALYRFLLELCQNQSSEFAHIGRGSETSQAYVDPEVASELTDNLNNKNGIDGNSLN